MLEPCKYYANEYTKHGCTQEGSQKYERQKIWTNISPLWTCYREHSIEAMMTYVIMHTQAKNDGICLRHLRKQHLWFVCHDLLLHVYVMFQGLYCSSSSVGSNVWNCFDNHRFNVSERPNRQNTHTHTLQCNPMPCPCLLNHKILIYTSNDTGIKHIDLMLSLFL